MADKIERTNTLVDIIWFSNSNLLEAGVSLSFEYGISLSLSTKENHVFNFQPDEAPCYHHPTLHHLKQHISQRFSLFLAE